jgi:hypothetical protein
MKRRTRHNALLPVGHPSWLVVRDEINDLVSDVEIAAGADLAQVLAEAMEKLEAEGWEMEEPPNATFAGFFCRRDEVRWLVHIAHVNPHEERNAPVRSAWTAPDSRVLPFRKQNTPNENE